MKDEDLSDLVHDTGTLETFLTSTLTSAISQGGDLIRSTRGGTDFVTGYTQNEQAVIDTEVRKRVAQEQKERGEKLSNKAIGKIQEQVQKDLDRGFISIDTIEEAIGGDTYRAYRAEVERKQQNAEKLERLQAEYDKLNDMKLGEMTGKDSDRKAVLKDDFLPKLKKLVEDDKVSTKEEDLRKTLTDNAAKLAKKDRLAESYNERERRKVAFAADLTGMSEKKAAVYQKAIDSGLLNNTNRTHEFVDMVAKISADKGIAFDFANNEKLKESGFALEGRTVNGFVGEEGITLNIQSANALNTVVGHEITHVLEGTELYTALQDAIVEYAKSKGEYRSRRDAVAKLYEGIEGADIDAELTADLVGDYLFSDTEFINSLSAGNRSLFQKIFDEVKYLCRTATAGSKEARHLEKVKRAFEEAYRANSQALENSQDENNTAENGGVQYSLSGNYDYSKPFSEQIDDWTKGRIPPNDSLVISETPQVWKLIGMNALPVTINQKHIDYAINGTKDADHYLTEKGIRQLPEAIKHPVAVISSKSNKNTSLVAMLDIRQNGKQVIVPVMIDGTGRQNNLRIDSNAIKSAYGKNFSISKVLYNALNDEANKQDYSVYYIDIKKATALLQGAKVPMPKMPVVSANGFVHSIDEVGSPVKKKIASQIDSQQFKQWFGNSKIVNDDGTPKIMYHGTPNGDFTVFRGWQYFTDNQAYADVYQNQGASSNGYKKTANAPKTYSVYLAPRKIFDTRNAAERQIFMDEFYQKWGNGAPLSDRGLPDWTDGDDLIEFFEENGYDYDAVFLDEGGTGGYGDAVNDRGISVVVRDPEAIKSATDNIGTYDGSNPDIRYSLSSEIAPTSPYSKKYKGNIRSEDVRYDPDYQVPWDIGPVAEQAAAGAADGDIGPVAEQTVAGAADGDIGPVPEDLMPPVAGEDIAPVPGGEDNRGPYDQEIKEREAELAEGKATFMSKSAKKLYDEKKGMKPGVRVSKWLSYLLDVRKNHDYSWDDLDGALVNVAEHPEGVTAQSAAEEIKALEAEIAVENDFKGRLAKKLYQEMSNLRKGKKASRELGYLLDLREQGYTWDEILDALLNTATHPGGFRVESSAVKIAALAEDLADKKTYISKRAEKLLKEVRKGKQPGQRATPELRYLLSWMRDKGEGYGTLRKGLANIVDWPEKIVDRRNRAEIEARRWLEELYAGETYELEKLRSREQELEMAGGDLVTNVDPESDMEQIVRDWLDELLEEKQEQLEALYEREAKLQEVGGTLVTSVNPDNPMEDIVREFLAGKFDDAGYELEMLRESTDASYAQRIENIGKRLNKFMKEDIQKAQDYSKDTNRNIRTVAAMKPVTNLQGNEFTAGGKDLRAQVVGFFKKIGGAVRNPKIGDVALTSRGVKDSLAHGMSNEKAAAFAAVPDVIKSGEIVHFDSNWKERGYASMTIAAPITIGNEPYMMAVILRRSNDNTRYYVHDVFAEKEATPFNRGRENGLPGGATSTLSIINQILNVKKQNAGKMSYEDWSSRKKYHGSLVDRVKNEFSKNGLDFDEALRNAKNLSTFATVDNTPQRVMEKSLGYKEGGILADMTVNQVAQNETEGIKWLNSYLNPKDGILAKISNKYDIKPNSKEDAAVQMYAEGFYVNEKNEIISYGDAELAQDFPNVQVQRNIKGMANDEMFRRIYDETLDMINASRKRNGYPEIPRLDNYYLHFRAMDDTFSKMGLPFNPKDIKAKDLPTDLNGVTADLKPGQPYFASAKHRTGKRTSFSALGGLERYLNSAMPQIFHIDDIQMLRALRNYVADTFGQANGLDGLDALTEEEQQERIQQVYGSHLSTFAKFLNEEANILAGKTALIDRGLEGVIGRRGITFLNELNKQVGSNQVGYNLSSPLTNFVSVAQAFAKTQKRDFIKAFGQTIASRIGRFSGGGDSFAEESPVMIRRKGADRFYRTPWQKISDAGYAMMSVTDSISTELIARTKYNEFTRKGVDSQRAHYETDKWVSKLMGDRSLGQMPQLFNSRMLGLLTKYQLEVRNQLDSQFYDTIQEAKASTEHIQDGLERNVRKAGKIAATFAELAVAQHLFGMAFEAVAGYNPAFDIIEAIIKTCGWDDDDESEDTFQDNLEQGFLTLIDDLPYTSTFTGGRIPLGSALPVRELLTGEDEYGNEKSRWESFGEAVPYYLMPGGYGQLKKTVQGLSMFDDDLPVTGSYTAGGDLRFPVEDTIGNRIQAGLFGQWANENAQEYLDEDWAPIDLTRTYEYMAAGLDIGDYRKFRSDLSKIGSDQDEDGKTISGSRKAKVLEYIADLDIDVGAKLILFKGQYKGDDTYNREIVQYLISREDLEYEDVVGILEFLEFKVNDGYVTWD